MEWLTVVTIVSIVLLAVISPGPDFAITTRNSLLYGRRSGLLTAVGIACGVSVHILYTLSGLSYLMAQSLWLLELLRYLGAAYLIWLGCQAFTSNKTDNIAREEAHTSTLSDRNAFRTGFLCNALNPKTALFFIALFTQVVTPGTGEMIQLLIGLFISAAHLVWFTVVAILLSHPRFQSRFEAAKHRIEKLTGLCLMGLGAKLGLNL